MMVLHVLVALGVIVATTRLVGRLFQRIGQPAVVGELVGGILLGPSLLGWVAPDLSAWLFPAVVLPLLRLHAQAGVIFFMFLVGLELDRQMLRRSSRATIFISYASIVLPFVLGYALAHPLYPRLSPPGVRFTPFALFIGVSMSITAFPVLARILRDRALNRTRMGNVAMACAAVDDVTAWCLLALVISITEFGDWESAIEHIPGVVAGHLSHYAIFAAFLAGALMPKQARLGGALHDRLAGILSVLFLPVFFAFSGIRTHVGLISGAANWGLCAAIIAVACVGKFGGGVIAARWTGIGWRDSAALGVLMNTRGLVELVVLNIGLDLGVISPTLFTMLVIMALVTTFMTSPLLQLLLRKHPWMPEVRVTAA
jgi:Kef-type K+ transport system membrane component KefB